VGRAELLQIFFGRSQAVGMQWIEGSEVENLTLVVRMEGAN
jgi:hypothetical protein